MCKSACSLGETNMSVTSVGLLVALYLYPVCQLHVRPHFTPYVDGEPEAMTDELKSRVTLRM